MPYQIVIHSSAALTTQEIIELQILAKADNLWNKIFLGDIQNAHSALCWQ